MTMYLTYVAGGKCRDTHAPIRDADGEPIKQPRVHKQFWVREELRRMGIDAWCGDRIDFKRKAGNHRTTEAVTTPALPNYMFIDLTPDQFFKAINVDHVSPTLKILNREDVHQLNRFKSAAEADFSAAQRVDANKRADVAQYVKGQRLRILDGLFADMTATFDKMIRAGHDEWPRVVADIDGRKVSFDPLDVRAG